MRIVGISEVEFDMLTVVWWLACDPKAAGTWEMQSSAVAMPLPRVRSPYIYNYIVNAETNPIRPSSIISVASTIGAAFPSCLVSSSQ